MAAWIVFIDAKSLRERKRCWNVSERRIRERTKKKRLSPSRGKFEFFRFDGVLHTELRALYKRVVSQQVLATTIVVQSQPAISFPSFCI